MKKDREAFELLKEVKELITDELSGKLQSSQKFEEIIARILSSSDLFHLYKREQMTSNE
jgi:hypothetical protein